jgi:hypothetical protein
MRRRRVTPQTRKYSQRKLHERSCERLLFFDGDRDSGKKLQLTRNARKRSPIHIVATAYRTGAVMTDVVNLNRFRKRVERDRQAKKADANRARFGRTKAEREADERREQRLREVHEQHRIKSGDEA